MVQHQTTGLQRPREHLEQVGLKDFRLCVCSLASLCCSLQWSPCPVLIILQDMHMLPQLIYKSLGSPTPGLPSGDMLLSPGMFFPLLFRKVTPVLKKHPVPCCLSIWFNDWFLNIFHQNLCCSLIIYLLIGLICCVMSGFVWLCMCVCFAYLSAFRSVIPVKLVQKWYIICASLIFIVLGKKSFWLKIFSILIICVLLVKCSILTHSLE